MVAPIEVRPLALALISILRERRERARLCPSNRKCSGKISGSISGLYLFPVKLSRKGGIKRKDLCWQQCCEARPSLGDYIALKTILLALKQPISSFLCANEIFIFHAAQFAIRRSAFSVTNEALKFPGRIKRRSFFICFVWDGGTPGQGNTIPLIYVNTSSQK